MDPAKLVPRPPNFGLSLVLFFTLIDHCHSSQSADEADPNETHDHGGGQPRFFSLSAGSKIYGGKFLTFLFYLFCCCNVLFDIFSCPGGAKMNFCILPIRETKEKKAIFEFF
jgi:hypothetical protein